MQLFVYSLPRFLRSRLRNGETGVLFFLPFSFVLDLISLLGLSLLGSDLSVYFYFFVFASLNPDLCTSILLQISV
jgi:hypothetical protein